MNIISDTPSKGYVKLSTKCRLSYMHVYWVLRPIDKQMNHIECHNITKPESGINENYLILLLSRRSCKTFLKYYMYIS